MNCRSLSLAFTHVACSCSLSLALTCVDLILFAFPCSRSRLLLLALARFHLGSRLFSVGLIVVCFRSLSLALARSHSLSLFLTSFDFLLLSLALMCFDLLPLALTSSQEDVARGRFACLRPHTCLNDEVIKLDFHLLEERSRAGKVPSKCWFPNYLFWSMLCGSDGKTYNYKNVQRWTIRAKIDIFAMDYVVFPMNTGDGTHWALGVIDIKGRGFRYFDSMCKSLTPTANVVPLRRYVNDELKAKNDGTTLADPDSWRLLEAKSPVPQQGNGYDCGVFVCSCCRLFCCGQTFYFWPGRHASAPVTVGGSPCQGS